MNPLENVSVGLTGEKQTIVTRDLTVGHFVEGMPFVYATPMMILLMEVASGAIIGELLPDGWVSVGMEVNVRHLAATPLERVVKATSRVIEVASSSVLFAVEAFDGGRKIGDGLHRRGIVNKTLFEKRFGAKA